MKKILKKIGFIFLILIILLFTAPFIFKGTIEEKINDSIEANLNGKLNYDNIDLSIIKNFPKVSIQLKNVVLTGANSFTNDTILHINKLSASFNLWKTWKSKNISISKIELSKGILNGVVSKTGEKNWDIIKNATETEQNNLNSDKEEDNISGVLWNKVELKDLVLSYTNNESKQIVKTHIKNIIIKGELSSNNDLILKIKGKMNNNFVKMDNKVWIEHLPLQCETKIHGNLEKMFFQIEKGNFTIKELPLTLVGNFSILNDIYKTDLKISSDNSNIKSLTSLIPKGVSKNIKDIETKGQFSFEAFIKGIYSEKEYPKIDLKTSILDGYVKFPKKNPIEKININATFSNYGDGLKHFRFNMPEASLSLASNPVKASLLADNITVSPQVKGNIKSNINLGELEKIFPMKDMSITGILDTDIAFNGNLTDIEKERYERFKTSGYAKLKNFIFSSKSFSSNISIEKANLDFKTRYIELKESFIHIGKNKLSLKGRLTNYIQYITKGKILSGNFALNSAFIDINDFKQLSTNNEDKQEKENEKKNNTESEILEVPKNLNLSLNCNINKIVYGVTDLRQIIGNIKIADGQITVTRTKLNMADGNINISGGYAPTRANKKTPFINFNTKIASISLPQLLKQMPVLKQTFPLGTETQGKISTQLNFNTELNNTMYPVRKTGNGNGNISINNLILTNNNLTKNLVMLTGNKELGRILISELLINYTIENGDIHVAPFQTSLAGRKTTGKGILFADNKLDFSIKLDLTSKDMEGKIGQQIKKIPGLDNLDKFPIALKITGTAEKPIVTPDIKNMASYLLKNAKGNIIKGFAKKLFGNSKKDKTD